MGVKVGSISKSKAWPEQAVVEVMQKTRQQHWVCLPLCMHFLTSSDCTFLTQVEEHVFSVGARGLIFRGDVETI